MVGGVAIVKWARSLLTVCGVVRPQALPLQQALLISDSSTPCMAFEPNSREC